MLLLEFPYITSKNGESSHSRSREFDLKVIVGYALIVCQDSLISLKFIKLSSVEESLGVGLLH